jgi:hypothetical protein
MYLPTDDLISRLPSSISYFGTPDTDEPPSLSGNAETAVPGQVAFVWPKDALARTSFSGHQIDPPERV